MSEHAMVPVIDLINHAPRDDMINVELVSSQRTKWKNIMVINGHYGSLSVIVGFYILTPCTES